MQISDDQLPAKIPKVSYGEHQLKWLLDTGAGFHVMTEGVWKSLGSPPLRSSSARLRGADGNDLDAIGILRVRGFAGPHRFQFDAVGSRSGSKVVSKRLTGSIKLHRELGREVLNMTVRKAHEIQALTTGQLQKEVEYVRAEIESIRAGRQNDANEA